MKVDAALIVSSLASLASIVSFLPQAWRVLKTRDVKGLSPVAYSITVSSFGLWTAFGVLRGEWALIVTNAICGIAAIFILTMRLRKG